MYPWRFNAAKCNAMITFSMDSLTAQRYQSICFWRLNIRINPNLKSSISISIMKSTWDLLTHLRVAFTAALFVGLGRTGFLCAPFFLLWTHTLNHTGPGLKGTPCLPFMSRYLPAPSALSSVCQSLQGCWIASLGPCGPFYLEHRCQELSQMNQINPAVFLSFSIHKHATTFF